jgi:hypothetical protein
MTYVRKECPAFCLISNILLFCISLDGLVPLRQELVNEPIRTAQDYLM